MLLTRIANAKADTLMDLLRQLQACKYNTYDEADRLKTVTIEALVKHNLKDQYYVIIDVWHDGFYRILVLNQDTN